MVEQYHNFELHHSALRDLIERQTGSLDRAILEAISNSIDAGAARIEILLTQEAVIIQDDGKGFTSEEDVSTNFRTFCQPHTAQEAKAIGAFRMGRGQLFAHGVNVWQSNTFQMAVDYKQRLGYTMSQLAAPRKGCQIEVVFYQPLSAVKRVEVVEDLARAAAWVTTPIYLNGKKINQSPYDRQWSIHGSYFVAELNLHGGTLEVYNLGILVRAYPRASYDVAGTIVSTLGMQLNFARNEPMQTCPVWQAVQKILPVETARLRQLHAKKATTPKEGKGDLSAFAKIPRLSVKERRKRLQTIIETGKPVDEHDFGQAMLQEAASGTKWLSPRKLWRLAKNTNYVVTAGYSHDVHVARGCCVLKLATPFSLISVYETKNQLEQEDRTGTALAKAFLQQLNKAFATGRRQPLRYLSKEEIAGQLVKHAAKLSRDRRSPLENALCGAVEVAIGELNNLPQVAAVEVASFGDRYAKARFTDDDAGSGDDVLLLSREFLSCRSPNFNWWQQLVTEIVTAYQERREYFKEPALPAEALLETYTQTSRFATRAVEHFLAHEHAALYQAKKQEAAVLDTLACYESAGKNLTLFRETLERLRTKLDQALAGWNPDQLVTEMEQRL